MAENADSTDTRLDAGLEQALAEAGAGCGEVGVGIPIGAAHLPGSPVASSSLASPPSAAAEASSEAPARPGHPAGIPMDRQRHGRAERGLQARRRP